ncbi:hypothetical protein EV702DRAFT_1108603 [Suillus placidus]|uniref:Uncharacterized protein n=1 Tax=Suillus placidus TaxID=48579 RepID=A0A9P6ZU47_9AGAM|nr:hypothetical protein EV702DRAFT_1108603 [Suillus placidus]
MAFKGSKYGTDHFSIRGFLAAIFRPFMSYPSDAPGVFTSGTSENGVEQWNTLVLNNEVSSQCQLERVVYGKCIKRKEHEFLLLHFRHPTQQHAVAILVLDRTPRRDSTQNSNGSSRQVGQSSCIASPSVSETSAYDSIYTTPNKGSAIANHLSAKYRSFKYHGTLDFPASARPSAIQVSVLLSTLSEHFPLYHVRQYQCYWYAHTVWEALKKLFPDCLETTLCEGRSRWFGVEINKADSVEVICEQYHTRWASIENAAEERRKAKEDEVRQLRMEGLAEGQAQSQAQINQALAREMEATKKADEAMRKAEEAERKAEEYRVEMNQMRARIAQLER